MERELAAEREEEERKEKARKAKLKKEREEERPMAVGAHALARQDGVETNGTYDIHPFSFRQYSPDLAGLHSSVNTRS